jgi:hypothetical protein
VIKEGVKYILELLGISFTFKSNRGAGKSLSRPTSRCILFDGENISFDASLVIQGVTGGTDQTSGGCSLC